MGGLAAHSNAVRSLWASIAPYTPVGTSKRSTQRACKCMLDLPYASDRTRQSAPSISSRCASTCMRTSGSRHFRMSTFTRQGQVCKGSGGWQDRLFYLFHDRHVTTYRVMLCARGLPCHQRIRRLWWCCRARQGEGREVQAAHAAEVFADVRSALSAQQSLRASAALQQPSTATPTPFSKHAAHCSAAPASARWAWEWHLLICCLWQSLSLCRSCVSSCQQSMTCFPITEAVCLAIIPCCMGIKGSLCRAQEAVRLVPG